MDHFAGTNIYGESEKICLLLLTLLLAWVRCRQHRTRMGLEDKSLDDRLRNRMNSTKSVCANTLCKGNVLSAPTATLLMESTSWDRSLKRRSSNRMKGVCICYPTIRENLAICNRPSTIVGRTRRLFIITFLVSDLILSYSYNRLDFHKTVEMAVPSSVTTCLETIMPIRTTIISMEGLLVEANHHQF